MAFKMTASLLIEFSGEKKEKLLKMYNMV